MADEKCVRMSFDDATNRVHMVFFFLCEVNHQCQFIFFLRTFQITCITFAVVLVGFDIAGNLNIFPEHRNEIETAE